MGHNSILRVRYEKGWVTMRGVDGTKILGPVRGGRVSAAAAAESLCTTAATAECHGRCKDGGGSQEASGRAVQEGSHGVLKGDTWTTNVRTTCVLQIIWAHSGNVTDYLYCGR